MKVIFQNFFVWAEEYQRDLTHNNQGPYRDMICSYPKLKHRSVPLHDPEQCHFRPNIFYFAGFSIRSSGTSVLYLVALWRPMQRHILYSAHVYSYSGYRVFPGGKAAGTWC
jgi:hypothetical protein